MGKTEEAPTLSADAPGPLRVYRWLGSVCEVGASLLAPMLPAKAVGANGTGEGVLIREGTVFTKSD